MSDIINTHDQLKAALVAGFQWPFAVSGSYTGARTLYFHAWEICHPTIPTDPTNRPTDRAKGRKEFRLFEETGVPRPDRKRRALTRAQLWVADTYGYMGRWVRNPMGDYVPAEINKRWPLRDASRQSNGLKVYGWQGHRAEASKLQGRHRPQTREICAAKSQAELLRILRAKSMARVGSNLGVTGNPAEVAAALSKPGTVFWHPLDERPPVYREDTTLKAKAPSK